jgi:glycosyltransferase involved in cell wall biosynthesis
MARLGIDATSVVPEGKGIARVQRRTVEALAALGRHELVVFARHPEELLGAIPVTARSALLWEQIGLPRVFREHDLDVLLTWTERLPLRGGGRYVVWLFEPPTHRIRQNRIVGAGAYQRASDLVTLALWQRSLRRAALVLVGSNATRDAIREVAPRAWTLYPGLDAMFTPGVGAHDSRYVLHIASNDPRDDTETALVAFAEVRRRVGSGIGLIVAGGRHVEADGVTSLGRVSDAELVELYRGAAAYLDCSLYEGFGYQVLEAMACGAPVVATRVTSIPEIVGDVGLLCEPDSPKDMAEALVRILSDEALAADLRHRGAERAARFTWEQTAHDLANAVDKLVAS